MSNSKSLIITNPEDFYLKTPLYQDCQYTPSQLKTLSQIAFYQGTLDVYCLGCDKESVFKAEPTPKTIEENVRWIDDLIKRSKPDQAIDILSKCSSIQFFCTRDNTHRIIFIFRIVKYHITKIGQYPSIADLATHEIQKYRKVLNNEDYRELSKAVGLVSHGIGIGSYIYLRRIIEKLIEESHARAKNEKDSVWDEDKYNQARIEERIKILKDYLPEFMVQNRKLYAILSKAVHELSEEECLKHFDTIKVGIELILDERLDEEEKKRKVEQATKKIGDIYKDLK